MVTDNLFGLFAKHFYKYSRRVFFPKIEIFWSRKTRQNAHNAFNSTYNNKKSINKIPFAKHFYKYSRRVFFPKIEIFWSRKTRQNAHNAFNSTYNNKKSINKIPFCKPSRRTC